MDDISLQSFVDFGAFSEHLDLTKFEPTDQAAVPPPCAASMTFHPVWNVGDDASGSSKAVRFDLDAKDAANPYNKNQSRVKRPMNSFMLFSNEMRPILQDQNKALTNNDISKMLGQMWKDMPYEEKRPYLERAMEIKSQFNACHPDYTYTKSPRKRQKVNKLRKFGSESTIKTESGESSTPAPAAASGHVVDVLLPNTSSVVVAGEKQPFSIELIQSISHQVSAELQLSSHDPRVCTLL